MVDNENITYIKSLLAYVDKSLPSLRYQVKEIKGLIVIATEGKRADRIQQLQGDKNQVSNTIKETLKNQRILKSILKELVGKK